MIDNFFSRLPPNAAAAMHASQGGGHSSQPQHHIVGNHGNRGPVSNRQLYDPDNPNSSRQQQHSTYHGTKPLHFQDPYENERTRGQDQNRGVYSEV